MLLESFIDIDIKDSNGKYSAYSALCCCFLFLACFLNKVKKYRYQKPHPKLKALPHPLPSKENMFWGQSATLRITPPSFVFALPYPGCQDPMAPRVSPPWALDSSNTDNSTHAQLQKLNSLREIITSLEDLFRTRNFARLII